MGVTRAILGACGELGLLYGFQWFSSLVAYLAVHPNDSWTYWALNGND
jgi:hypothetical protein